MRLTNSLREKYSKVYLPLLRLASAYFSLIILKSLPLGSVFLGFKEENSNDLE